MIKTAFKNYFQNLKYFFLVLIIIYSAIVISGLIVFYGAMAPVKTASAQIYQNITDYLSSLAGGGLIAVLRADFLKEILNELNTSLLGLSDFKFGSALFLLGFAALILIGSFKISEILAKSRMRKNIETKNSLKGFFVVVLRLVISFFFYVLYLVIVYFWFFAIFLLPFISSMVNSLENLFTDWLIHFRNVKFSKIINFKSMLALAAGDFLLELANTVVIVLIALINVPAALLVAMPLLTYTAAVSDITSTRYFFDKQAEGEFDLTPVESN